MLVYMYAMDMIQIQESKSKTQRMYEKAELIVKAKRVRRTSNRNIWIVGSGNVKTPSKYYAVIWDEELQALICDCPAFTYCPAEDSDGKPYCCHLLAAAMFESGGLT
jgi:hypothetical protein